MSWHHNPDLEKHIFSSPKDWSKWVTVMWSWHPEAHVHVKKALSVKIDPLVTVKALAPHLTTQKRKSHVSAVNPEQTVSRFCQDIKLIPLITETGIADTPMWRRSWCESVKPDDSGQTIRQPVRRPAGWHVTVWHDSRVLWKLLIRYVGQQQYRVPVMLVRIVLNDTTC